jgi:phospholipid/cholesterol/gamma-HCH transport system ATP-binding protein
MPESAATTPRIELRHVRKAFGPKLVLADVSLKVMPGESLVIIGGSGTGKSVTLKCILGILAHDSGEVLIDGRPLAGIDRRAWLRHFGMLFQGGALFDSLTVWQNVAFRLIHARRDPLGRKAARDLAIAKLGRVGLAPETADLYPAELSGGMQKRVGLARAIATDPEVIFFDEPTAGLDPILAHVINELIRELVEEMGATAITISHDMTTVRTVADHVAMLHDGHVRWSGHIDEMDASGDPYLQQFIHGRAEGPIETVR